MVCGKRNEADNLYPHSALKPKRSLPQLPNPLTFRLIFQLEKTEDKQISLVTRRRPVYSSWQEATVDQTGWVHYGASLQGCPSTPGVNQQ